ILQLRLIEQQVGPLLGGRQVVPCEGVHVGAGAKRGCALGCGPTRRRRLAAKDPGEHEFSSLPPSRPGRRGLTEMARDRAITLVSGPADRSGAILPSAIRWR